MGAHTAHFARSLTRSSSSAQEMRLFSENAERRKMESLADLFSIIKACVRRVAPP